MGRMHVGSWRRFALAASVFWAGSTAAMPQYHYKDILVGERAMGLAGSYAAISDDPSGAFHNPAGMLYGLENYISLSVNAFTSSQERYDNVFPGQPYTLTSQQLLPVTFGFLQTLGHGKFAFLVATPSSSSRDQSDAVMDGATQATSTVGLQRKFVENDTTYWLGPAYALELSPKWSLGFSAFGAVRLYRAVDLQTVLYTPVGSGPYYLATTQINSTSYAWVPKVGVQYMPTPKWCLAATLSQMFNLTGTGTLKIVNSNLGPGNTPPAPTGNYQTDFTTQQGDVFTDLPTPLEATLGTAYFASKSLLFTAQLDYHGAQADYRVRPVTAVLNWSVATEYYFNEGFALRGGVFSNNINTPAIDPTQVNQSPHVDLIGVATGVSFYRPGSSVTLGATYEYGVGQGQQISGSTNVQTLTSTELAIYLGGSYQI